MTARSTAGARRAGRGPAGTAIRHGKDGPKRVRSGGARWTDEAELIFLDRLAASCNVSLAAGACGFNVESIYRRRRQDATFAAAWQAALEQGYARIEMALVRRAADAMEGLEPDPATPIPVMTVEQAMAVLQRHRATVEGAESRRRWARPRSLDEVRGSILTKLEALASARCGEVAAGEP